MRDNKLALFSLVMLAGEAKSWKVQIIWSLLWLVIFMFSVSKEEK